ncbi:hypothetical protein AM232_05585 [Bacillus sp. FJAT-21352]|nr:hypothetical protein AM232_05585 [Bacillus sp. FJAT-21352]
MKKKLVLNMVRNKTSQQFFLLKHKVDWNGRYETPAGKAWQGRPRRRAEEAPGTPAESECLKWKSKFYTASKKLWTKGFLSLKHKVDWNGCSRLLREKRGKGDPAGIAEEAPERPRKASA